MMVNILIAARLPLGQFAEIQISAQLDAAAALGVLFSTGVVILSLFGLAVGRLINLLETRLLHWR
ncbi:MAG: hypothetical protein QOJ84_4919 [Bradyrhizobium sp.]|jgi:hypothetical protein|nr:hypothetical protein [Bradyrhizobium sp.]